MLVPAIQSKHSLMGFPTSFSIAINIRHRTIPLIPPPSKDKSCKDIESNQTTNITSIPHTILKYKLKAYHFQIRNQFAYVLYIHVVIIILRYLINIKILYMYPYVARLHVCIICICASCPRILCITFCIFSRDTRFIANADKVIYINKNKINFKVNSLKWKAKQNNKVKKFS